MSIINDYGWQVAGTAQQRSTVSAGSNAVPYVPVSLSTQPAPDSRKSGGSSEQRFQDNQQEAFAKLKVALQNADQTSSKKETQSNALKEFRAYMALSPEQKIREKMLREMGLSLEDYEALPPEKKEKIDKLITQRMQEELEAKTTAKLQVQQRSAVAAEATAGVQESSLEGTKKKDQKDPLG